MMQTQCPQCHTAFRVSEEQLELAGGRVRCGQCLHVFVAREHFIDTLPAKTIDLISADEITLPDIETDNQLVEVELEGIELEQPEELVLTELDVPEIEIPSLDALDDHAEQPLETEAASTEPPAEDATETLAKAPADTSTGIGGVESTPPTDAVAGLPPAINTAWLGHYAANEEYQPDELAAGEIQTGQTVEVAEATQGQQAATAATDITEPSGPDETIPLLTETYDAAQLYPELSAAPMPVRTAHTGLYSLAILALLVTFLLQATYVLRDTLAEQPALRPFMSDFCAVLDCRLSLPREPEKILLTRSEVRSHPAQRGALLVKASMQNRAHFRQPYPVLRLQFTDLDGRALVGRDFLPREYLPDDVNIQAGMPINSDVNLSLELVDPGGQAVSFNFNLL
ncbi:DUF3426 domain-containing protein [Sulfuriflexus mobilis]|uniref:DUF3426 domain-containing protein n=1 Tax=Sulfuriflexus mobilis TaxID=1811807 RepID=UPI000F833105|nr:DUF3426 domain-containing protein [Sulfuriflexus mobilis]